MMKIDEDANYGTCDLHSREIKKLIAMEELGELIQAIRKCKTNKDLKERTGIYDRNK